MDVNDVIEVKILGSRGNYGVGRVADMTVLVLDASPVSLVRVRVVRVDKPLVYAEVVDVLSPAHPKKGVGLGDEDDDSIDYPEDLLREVEERKG